MVVNAILNPKKLSQFIVVVLFLMAAMLMSGYIAIGQLSEAERIFWSTSQIIILLFVLVLVWVYMTKYHR